MIFPPFYVLYEKIDFSLGSSYHSGGMQRIKTKIKVVARKAKPVFYADTVSG